MAQVKIATAHTATAIWIKVDEKKRPLSNGKTTIELAPGDHLLFYGMIGPAGSTITIDVTEGAVVLKHKTDSVPSNGDPGAGGFKFTVV